MPQIIFAKSNVKPSPPALGRVSVYVKEDNIIYIQDSEGAETALPTEENLETAILNTLSTNNVAFKNIENTYTEAQTFEKGLLSKSEVREVPIKTSISGAYTISISNGSLFDLTLVGDCTFTFPEPTAGRQFTLILKQDATGNRIITWPTISWPADTIPTLTTTANKTDIFSFISDGTYWLGFVNAQNFTRG